jgi:hypothetical protein
VNHRVFAALTYFETKCMVQTQRRFRFEFDVPRRGRIPSYDAILKWVEGFVVYGTAVNEFAGTACSIRTLHDPSVRAGEGGSFLRPRGHYEPTHYKSHYGYFFRF